MTFHSPSTRRIGVGLALACLPLFVSLSGCDEVREERVLDVETPGFDLEVDKVEGDRGLEKIEIESESTND